MENKDYISGGMDIDLENETVNSLEKIQEVLKIILDRTRVIVNKSMVVIENFNHSLINMVTILNLLDRYIYLSKYANRKRIRNKYKKRLYECLGREFTNKIIKEIYAY